MFDQYIGDETPTSVISCTVQAFSLRLGKAHPRRLMRITAIDRYLNYHVHEFERALLEKFPTCSMTVKRKSTGAYSVAIRIGTPPNSTEEGVPYSLLHAGRRGSWCKRI